MLQKFTNQTKFPTCTARNLAWSFDHLLIRGDITVNQLPCLMDINLTPIPNSIIPSDHLPVVNKITL